MSEKNIKDEADEVLEKLFSKSKISRTLPQNYREDIEKKLDNIVKKDSKNGKKKVTLVTARSALRLFPLLAQGGEFKFGGRRDEGIPVSDARYVLALWRSIMIKYFMVDHYAIIKNRHGDLALSAATAAVSDIAKSVGTAALRADQVDAIISGRDYDIIEAANFDLDLLTQPDYKTELLKYRPLWEETPFGSQDKWVEVQQDWETALDKLLNNEVIQSDQNLHFAIARLRDDYQIVLYAKPEEGKLDTVINHQPDNNQVFDDIAQQDYLGREPLVNSLVDRVLASDRDEHLTIGLFGEWGAGKSTFVNLLKQELGEAYDNDKKVQFLYGEFNAWRYEHTDNLQAGITQEVIDALTGYVPPFKVDYSGESKLKKLALYLWQPFEYLKEACQSLLWKSVVRSGLIVRFAWSLYSTRISFFISLLSVLFFLPHDIKTTSWDWLLLHLNKATGDIPELMSGAGIVGIVYLLFLLGKQLKIILSQPLASELKTYLNLPHYGEHLGELPVMAKHIKAMCAVRLGQSWWPKKLGGTDKKLLFVIDDLDRCEMEGVVKTLEAVRLILDVPNVVVVIAVDQRIALPALACKYEKLSQHHQSDVKAIARDYLAKVIHLPIYLPSPDDQSVAEFLAKIWNDEKFLRDIYKATTINPVVGANNKQKVELGKQGESSQPSGNNSYEGETIEELVNSLKYFDIQKEYRNWQSEDEPEEEIKNELTPEQKASFYVWLLKYDLRNPRQIKRLYNSYNLLQQVYIEKITVETDEFNFPLMVALFSLEAIHDNLSYEVKEGSDNKVKAKELLFAGTDKDGDFSKLVKSEILATSLTEAKEIIDKSGINNLEMLIGPFVLPAIEASEQARG